MVEMNGKAENFAEVPGHTLLLSNNTKGFLPCSGVDSCGILTYHLVVATAALLLPPGGGLGTKGCGAAPSVCSCSRAFAASRLFVFVWV